MYVTIFKIINITRNIIECDLEVCGDSKPQPGRERKNISSVRIENTPNI